MTLDLQSFEHAIVRHCSPTIAGIKPGCLFNVPGAFAPDCTKDSLTQQEQAQAAQILCDKLDRLVAKVSAKLERSNIYVRVIAHRHCGALIYVYRPNMLKASIAQKRIAARLVEWGYSTFELTNLDAALAHLGVRLELCNKDRNALPFPHEIGFFLGYPYEDVMGFIEHKGQDYLCCGCWKVYSQKERAEACFARYKRCTAAFEQLLGRGISIADLPSFQIEAA